MLIDARTDGNRWRVSSVRPDGSCGVTVYTNDFAHLERIVNAIETDYIDLVSYVVEPFCPAWPVLQ